MIPYAHVFFIKLPNQVVVEIEIVGLMRGEERANGGYIYYWHHRCCILGSTSHTQRPLRTMKKSTLAVTTAQVTRTPGRPALFSRIPVPVATLGHTAPPCRSDTAGISTCGIPYTLGAITLPSASTMTLVQVRTSTSCSFGEKTASTCHVMPHGLSLPT